MVSGAEVDKVVRLLGEPQLAASLAPATQAALQQVATTDIHK